MWPLISFLRSYAAIMFQRKVCHKNAFCCRMDRNLHQKSWFCVSGEVYEIIGRVIHCDVSSWRSDLEVFFLGFLYGSVFLKNLRTIRVLKYAKLVETIFVKQKQELLNQVYWSVTLPQYTHKMLQLEISMLFMTAPSNISFHFQELKHPKMYCVWS